MNHVFVLNPFAGKVSGEEELRRKVGALSLPNVTVYVTKSRRDATVFAENWCREHAGEETRFYACGGDGTLNEVVNGTVGFSGVSVYPYPCGSGNDFIKYYGTADAFLSLSEENVTVPVDLMKVGDRYAVNVINAGFDAEACRTMIEVKKKKLIGGKNAYTTGVAKALLTAMKNKCTVTVDGEPINDGTMLLCSVANGQYYGGAYRCAPRSDNADGLLDVCFVKPVSRLTFLRLVKSYAAGEHLDDPRFSKFIVYRRGKHIEITGEKPFACCLDGEVFDGTRFVIDAVESGVQIAVPAALAKVPV